MKIKQIRQRLIKKLKQKSKKLFCSFLLLFFALTLLLRFVPIPFSAYMLQQKIANFSVANNYSIQYQWVPLEKISWQMQLAVIAAEDQLFAQHHGFDWNSIEKAILHNQQSSRTRGGSSISQQTAKNLYLWHGQSWLRKGLEIPVTLSLELLWNKKRILEVYLNIAEFGRGIFGVEATSQHYFKKSAQYLTQQEAALLAAILPNPIIFKANNPSAYTKRKQKWIMQQMNNLGKSYLNNL
ncbi:monofunctional biosynthetic peptidoglycan transglycosylase [Canicola haemoglobinophilus]|nr:monofunctional biosynthetic peptidoglycan transglycosylase [Canicola haemoglobinophilus]OOR98824.1 monofunctional biosynthetic peptidoglycan transglycosylase [Canicola haemoglobinophilus]